MAKPVLGRGLSALLGGVSSAVKASPFAPVTAPETVVGPEASERVQLVSIQRVHPCPFQPRKDFSDESLRELADSIQEQGIVQPLIVRSQGSDFELIAGERRWRAAQIVGLKEIPVIVRTADDRTVLELALIENLQRENLNPIEEALGYAQLIDQFQLKQEEAAAKVGKSRTVVANALRLLKLAPELQAYVRHGQLSVGHAKVILGLAGHEAQKLATEKIIKSSLSVRQTEELVAHWQNDSSLAGSGQDAKKSAPSVPRDLHILDLESKIRERFGTKVQLRYRQGKGALEIKFFNDRDLERILQLAGIALD